jgi:hypothetical protein
MANEELDQYVVRRLFIGPVGEKPITHEVKARMISLNRSKLGQAVLVDGPEMKPEVVKYWSMLGQIVKQNPGGGFYLCARAAFVAGLNQSGRGGFILNPDIELEHSCWRYHDVMKTGNWLSGLTCQRLEKEGLLISRSIKTAPEGRKILEETRKDDGVLVIRQQLFFPQLGMSADGEMEEYGHYVAMLSKGVIGGILDPYGLDGFFARVADEQTVLDNIQMAAGHAGLSDGGEINAYSFYPKRVEKVYLG